MDNKDDDSNNDDNNPNNPTNNNDEIKSKLEEMDIAIKAVQSENEKLKSENTNIKNEIAILKENKRIKLMNSPVIITLPTVGWQEGDTENIQLSDSIENYRYLEIQFNYQTVDNTIFLATEQLISYNNSNDFSKCNESLFYLDYSANGKDFGSACWFKNNKLLHIGPIWNNVSETVDIKIKNIYGIK